MQTRMPTFHVDDKKQTNFPDIIEHIRKTLGIFKCRVPCAVPELLGKCRLEDHEQSEFQCERLQSDLQNPDHWLWTLDPSAHHLMCCQALQCRPQCPLHTLLCSSVAIKWGQTSDAPLPLQWHFFEACVSNKNVSSVTCHNNDDHIVVKHVCFLFCLMSLSNTPTQLIQSSIDQLGMRKQCACESWLWPAKRQNAFEKVAEQWEIFRSTGN